MAIQVSGTTVIDDSRNLLNVIGLKTVGGTAILGSGDIAVGASTALNGVGTYTLAYDTGMQDGGYNNNQAYKAGRTAAGSALRTRAAMAFNGTTAGTATSTGGTTVGQNYAAPNAWGAVITDNNTFSGTWRLMSTGTNYLSATAATSQPTWKTYYTALWVRYV
jgi:hypothetical protein